MTELEMRVLSELEEARAENVSSTLNTVMKATGEEHQVEEFQLALEALVQSDLVLIAYEQPGSNVLECVSKERSIVAVRGIRSQLTFSESDGLWVWDQREPWAELWATDLGLSRAREILDERGYQWWRKEK